MVSSYSDIAQFTSVFRAQSLSDQRHRVAKRNRQPVSCLACRARKLRCDRASPCGACAKRGDGDACKFGVAVSGNGGNGNESDSGRDSHAAAVPSSSGRHHGAHGASGEAVGEGLLHQRPELQQRIQKLEGMVQDLVRMGLSSSQARDRTAPGPTKHPTVPTPTNSEPGSSGHSPAPLPPDGQDAYYGATHWTALLQHIREIQTALEPDPTVLPEPPEGGACSIGPDFLFGAVVAVSLPEVLSSLPPRQDLDKLLSVYFHARFSAAPFIHVGRFQREYEAFWKKPEGASFLWISILFSIISSAAIIVHGKGSAETLGLNRRLKEPAAYTGRAVQCLLKGDYLAAGTYSVEATILVAYTRVMGSKDMDPTLSNMFGVATRLAQRRGYHLDPKHLSTSISPFEAEMRRRAWFYCETFDLLLSFQLGMPAIVHEGDGDARGPENHPDEDFDEDTVTMPPPRPPTDPTPMLYYCWKSKLCHILRRVIRHALSPAQPAYAETCALNDALYTWHDELPATMRVRPIRATGFTEQNYTVMQRLMLELMYSKALCVLHRAYLTRDKADPRFAASREICRDAALRVLDLHAEFDREASPGGRLYEDRYMLSSLTLHDFMIAAMVVCLDLNESTDTSDEDYERKMSALRTASEIWSNRSSCSRDARHAATVLRAMVQRLTSQRMCKSGSRSGYLRTAMADVGRNGDCDQDPTSSSQSSAATLGLGDAGGGGVECDQLYGVGIDHGFDFDYMTLDNALNDPSNLDWTLLDQYWMPDRSDQLVMDVSL
ncbi:putative transcriptional regulatory protein C1F7.11c [Colletotrichum tanaceti]|uniref:Putative transcriptional regulatory protein C1F7.11c n=1 Tax=Colletotrichum tanaceti TaxID=1306861 RepID=A0A4U6X470_9PEZI|nr:putative transcriptional regulatory protein C1F7.11c [Colletotrichum tanaceti]TKW49579.1 putative transcriptional regulatory protein C1F7.11c [Colletotrichum tanaceti]